MNPFDKFFDDKPYTQKLLKYALSNVNSKSVGNLVKLNLQSFLDKYQQSKTDSNCKYFFNTDAVERVCQFFGFIKHIKGPLSGTYIKLEEWQIFYLGNIFGWQKKKNKTRQYKYSYLEVARKNAKTTLLSGIMLYGLIADNEASGENYCFGVKRDQARLLFDTAKQMVKTSPELSSIITVYEHRLVVKDTNSIFKPLASKTNSLDGLNTHFAALDEVHEYPDDKLYNVIKSSTGARNNSHVFIITTAGTNTAGFCYQLRNVLIKILKKDLVDDSYFSLIYELDEKDDWQDESVWIKANPNLNISTSEDYLFGEYQQSLNFSSEQANFQVKHLNLWQNSSTSWITFEDWKQTTLDISDQELSQYPAYGGLDMSSVRDFTAFSLIFDLGIDKLYLKTWLWLPADMLNKRINRDKNHYQVWLDEGHIRTTEGNVIDEYTIFDEIRELSIKYNIQSVAYDRKFALTLVPKLEEIGIPMNDFPQHMKNMCPATKQFEIFTLKQQLTHNYNPAFEWMMSNVSLFTNYNNESKPDKKTSSEKIDGPISAVIAMGEFIISRGLEPQGYDSIAPISWV